MEWEKLEEEFLKNEHGLVVAECGNEISEILGCSEKSMEVILSPVSLRKNLHHHPDIGLEEYLILDVLIRTPDLILQDRAYHVIVISSRDQIVYHCVLKCTRSGKTLFLISFRRTSEKDIQRITQRSKLVVKGK